VIELSELPEYEDKQVTVEGIVAEHYITSYESQIIKIEGDNATAMELMAVEEWTGVVMPANLAYLLIALILGGTLSYFLTLSVGKIFARHFANVPYQSIVGLTIAMVVILVFLFTGILGILILVVATFIGLLPVHWGVRRSHCMGILLIPIILHFL